MYKVLKFIFFFTIIFCFSFSLILFFTHEPVFLQKQTSTKIYDRQGELLYEVLIPKRGKQDFITLRDISPYLIKSILVIEDQDFYQHFGLDFSAILRAFWQNFYYGEIISGASTIEQQLARNLYQHQARTFKNKIQESLLALKFNLKYNKNQILEKYLNTIYYGNLSYGIETASQTYFGKTAGKLDLAESAYLASLPQAPSRYSPYVNLKQGQMRQSQILNLLFKKGQITQEEREVALEEKLDFLPQKLVEIKAPHFVMWFLQKLEKEGKLKEVAKGNQKLITSLDLGLQNEVKNLINLHLEKLKYKNITNAAVVVFDQTKNEVLVMQGSRDYFDTEIDGEVNVALSLRQPGSTLKPFLYNLAFEKGFSSETKIRDEKVQFQTVEGHPYEPKNYDLKYHGQVTLREALAQSLNIPAVKLLNYLSVDDFLNYLEQFGIHSLNYSSDFYGLSLALGSGEVRLLELTEAYAKLGSEVTSILTDNYARIPAFGEDSSLSFNYPVAVKTGTSRNFRDNWTIGYTPLRTVGVWVGNNDSSSMIDSSGITGAAPLFHSVMDLVMQDLPKIKFDFSKKIQGKNNPILDFDLLKTGKGEQNNYTRKIIQYPFDGDIFRISLDLPLEEQVLIFKAKEEGEWFLNDIKIGEGKRLEWQLEKGDFQLKFNSENFLEKIGFSVE